MNSTDESASASFRSTVSSPGMPKTWRTPSASRHSTNTAAAFRAAKPLLLDSSRLYPRRGVARSRKRSAAAALKATFSPADRSVHASRVTRLLVEGAAGAWVPGAERRPAPRPRLARLALDLGGEGLAAVRTPRAGERAVAPVVVRRRDVRRTGRGARGVRGARVLVDLRGDLVGLEQAVQEVAPAARQDLREPQQGIERGGHEHVEAWVLEPVDEREPDLVGLD